MSRSKVATCQSSSTSTPHGEQRSDIVPTTMHLRLASIIVSSACPGPSLTPDHLSIPTRCGPCVLLAKELDRVAADLGEGVKILKVDTDENPELSSQLQARVVPCL